ncbi:Uncharacterized protein SCF082_LOCUS33891 [Durusdinium trenchii]|uniref:Transposase n=1 Tax=Durusdinium trenchii TaxID=1381693 RepID=A0ABP0NS91_9DINO
MLAVRRAAVRSRLPLVAWTGTLRPRGTSDEARGGDGEPPARGGRPKGNGHVKYFNNGWFMICSPENQLILSVVEMFEPEGHQVALESLTKLLQHYPNINAVIYDRACSVVAAARKDKALSGIKHWSVDKFHAKGHVHECPGHPERLPALKRRLKGLNTSISEQTFLGSAGTKFLTLRSTLAHSPVLDAIVTSAIHNEDTERSPRCEERELRDLFIEAEHFGLPELRGRILKKRKVAHMVSLFSGSAGNPFDLAARSLSTLRNMALVGATTAASGMALLQQLRETEVPGFLCRMGRKCLVTSA